MADTTPNARNDDADEIVVTLARKTKKVKIVGEDGTEKSYTLREMTGGARDKYIASQDKRQKLIDGRPSGIGNYDNIQADLISICLYDESGNQVETKVIATWPASQQMQLFKACVSLNGLEAPQEAGKNV